MNFVVVSTAYRPSDAVRHRCEKSVRVQTIPARHVYIADTVGGCMLENLYNAITELDPTDIVCSVDGDDWLTDPRALEHVACAYVTGAWMTWGQFVQYENGKRTKNGHAFDVRNRRACRQSPWYASHLKTYRAGLFQQIKWTDLRMNGAWLQQCCDLAVMFPLLEMSDDRGKFIARPIYGYDYTDRRARKNDKPGSPLNIEQKACERHVRSLPVYPRLDVAPW